jgi:ataxin-3
MNLSCALITSTEMVEAQQNPVAETGFICNLQSHWFALRKFPNEVLSTANQSRNASDSTDQWVNLNSILEHGPEIISDFYLSAYLAQLQAEGYSIFVVRGEWPPLCLSTVDRLDGLGEWIPMRTIQERHLNPPPPSTSARSNRPASPPSYFNEDDDLAAAINASLENVEDDEELRRAIAQSLSQ